MRHIAVLDKKPVFSGKHSIPDGAIVGNGDLCLILGNCDEGLRIYLSKCDLWEGIESYDKGGVKPLGYMDIPIPADCYNHYYVEQDMDLGEVRCTFTEKFCLRMCICKTENILLLESTGSSSISPVLKVFEGETTGEKGTFAEGELTGIYRIFRGEDHLYETHGYGVMRRVDDGRFVVSVVTNHDTENPKNAAIESAKTADFEKLCADHAEAWRKFHEKSAFTLSDPDLENGWYASQYFLACTAGNPHFPPGLFANFITVEHPAWHSDYHLNYNYQAPFYAALSSNHVECTDCYAAPLEEFMEKGHEFANRFGCEGILLPVGIAPKGMCTELKKELKYSFLRLFLGQKSNGIHPANIMIFRWRATRDLRYAKEHAYPYLKAALRFFEDYAKFENGRLNIPQDAAHEVPYYKDDFNPKKYKRYINDTNNCLTLGLLRQGLTAAIDMAKALGVDEDKQTQWADFLEKLPPFPTYHRWFQKVYRYTEKGQMWNETGDVGMQHIYPCGAVGLSSDKKTLKIARTTFRMKARYCWDDDNAVSSFFPMAARLGIDPKEITKKLHALIENRMQQNMLFRYGGGCLEYISIFASTLNEMALQSHENILRLFPDWDTSIHAKFEHLLADGGYLVSAEIHDGQISGVRIECTCLGTLRLQNPFRTATITHNNQARICGDEIVEIPVQPGDHITVEQAF